MYDTLLDDLLTICDAYAARATKLPEVLASRENHAKYLSGVAAVVRERGTIDQRQIDRVVEVCDTIDTWRTIEEPLAELQRLRLLVTPVAPGLIFAIERIVRRELLTLLTAPREEEPTPGEESLAPDLSHIPAQLPVAELRKRVRAMDCIVYLDRDRSYRRRAESMGLPFAEYNADEGAGRLTSVLVIDRLTFREYLSKGEKAMASREAQPCLL